METTTYFKKIEIIIDKRYSQSYGNKITLAFKAGYKRGNLIHLIDDNGVESDRYYLTGKHFHGFNGIEISESAFKNLTDKMYKYFKNKMDKERDYQNEELAKKAKIYEIELKKALKICTENKDYFQSYYLNNKPKINGCLGSHKASTYMAFMLYGKFDLSITALKNALKKTF